MLRGEIIMKESNKKIFNKKILISAIVLILAFFALYFILYFKNVSGQILEVKLSEIAVFKVEELYTEEALLKKGITPEQVRDILNHPDQYRDIVFRFQITNHSTAAGVGNIEIDKHLPEEAKKRLIWMEKNINHPVVTAAEKRPDGITAIFKLEEGDTEEDLIEICKQIRFTLKGRKVGFFDHGTITVPIQYSGE